MVWIQRYHCLMSLRKEQFAVGEFYHVYSRGVDKRVIFDDTYDKVRFQALLYLCNGEKSVVMRNIKDGGWFSVHHKQKPIVSIGAYCLMPNHFHLLVREIVEGGLSKFIQKLNTSYSMYFNAKNERKGALFESAFQSKHITDDVYFNHLFSYIHLNPLSIQFPEWKKGIVHKELATTFLESYPYSSLMDYKTDMHREESIILKPDDFPKQDINYEEMMESYQSWIDFVNEQNKK